MQREVDLQLCCQSPRELSLKICCGCFESPQNHTGLVSEQLGLVEGVVVHGPRGLELSDL